MHYRPKETDFECMNERNRKQVNPEVFVCHPLNLAKSLNAFDSNILKDLDHGHTVRYYDRHAGHLYILMEYRGGGDLSSVIK